MKTIRSAQVDTDFDRWFGTSKVVDNQGRPLLVYHGTASEEFDEFEPSVYKGQIGGIFFTPDRGVAEDFAEAASESAGGDPRVVEAYLSAQNPKIIKAAEIMRDGVHSFDREFEAVVKAREEGYDSLLIKDVPEHSRTADQWVVLRSNQIRIRK